MSCAVERVRVVAGDVPATCRGCAQLVGNAVALALRGGAHTRLLFVSSTAVKAPVQGRVYDEDERDRHRRSHASPATGYGRTKRAAEALVRAAAKSYPDRVHVAVVRLGNVSPPTFSARCLRRVVARAWCLHGRLSK